jgi:hypothetical protein
MAQTHSGRQHVTQQRHGPFNFFAQQDRSPPSRQVLLEPQISGQLLGWGGLAALGDWAAGKAFASSAERPDLNH